MYLEKHLSGKYPFVFILLLIMLLNTSIVYAQDGISHIYWAPSWSPEGTQIAFTSNIAETFDIWIMDINKREKINLTFESGGNDMWSVWSPNGRFIAFQSDRSGRLDLWVMEANGSNPSNLTKSENGLGIGDNITWSPDSRFIAFTIVQPSNFRKDLWIVEADGSNLINLTSKYKDLKNSDMPMWSSDGCCIVFVAGQPFSDTDIWKLELDGLTLTRLTDSENTWKMSPAWSPNDQFIAFTSTRNIKDEEASHKWDIWIMGTDGENLTNLTIGSDARDVFLEWSPDSSQILFSSDRSASVDLWIMNISDNLSPFNLTAGEYNDIGFGKWSPKGEHILFVSDPVEHSEIWLMDINNLSRTNLTKDN